MTEPEDLAARSLVGDDSYLLIGSILSLEEESDIGLSMAVRLAVREVNRQGGLVNGRKLGLVVCDNGGPDDAADGEARVALNERALDHLSGTLGAPVIVGPTRSSDSLTLVNHALKRRYPTVMISPSATSPALTNQPDRLSEDDPFGLFWRTCPSDQLQGRVLAEEVIGPDATIERVAVVYIQDTYGEPLAGVFQERYGLDNTVSIPFTSGSNLGNLAPQIADESVDAVLIIAGNGGDALAILEGFVGTPVEPLKFFFTDGSKDATRLLDPTLSAALKTMISTSRGTAPASPSGSIYNLFKTNLQKDFSLSADAFAFLAQAYDAAYIGAYGIVYASRNGNDFDGRDVAEGLSRLSAGSTIDIGPTTWPTAKGMLTSGSRQMDIEGTSGSLDFDAAIGEAPGPIEIWGVNAGSTSFVTLGVVEPD